MSWGATQGYAECIGAYVFRWTVHGSQACNLVYKNMFEPDVIFDTFVDEGYTVVVCITIPFETICNLTLTGEYLQENESLIRPPPPLSK